ncbi:MAG: reverse transcriptase-like protein [Desulfobulbaceae bacterium]|nr:reverse transcriptase-like protein [Desulfobulbaceae bacterium]
MHEQLDRKAVLKALAIELPDPVLTEIFPEVNPDTIRDLLAGGNRSAVLKNTSTEPTGNTAETAEIKTVADRQYRLYTDGASRGNPGEAGAGMVLFDDNGQELSARVLYLGRCTNNVAEYRALIGGLEMARQLDCTDLKIFLDSELIVRQVEGRYKVKNAALKPLFAEVKKMLTGLERWNISHVPRSRNKRADELANRAIDEKNAIQRNTIK